MGEPFDVAAAAATFAAREAARREKRLSLHAQASADYARILDMIIRDFRPLRVVQWGSLLVPEDFDETSDIDIAVEGLADARSFLDLLGRAMGMTGFPVDLVEWEKLDAPSRESILARGRTVYERGG